MKDEVVVKLTLEDKEQRAISVPVGHDLDKFSDNMMSCLNELLHDVMSVKLFHKPLVSINSAQKDTVMRSVDNLNK